MKRRAHFSQWWWRHPAGAPRATIGIARETPVSTTRRSRNGEEAEEAEYPVRRVTGRDQHLEGGTRAKQSGGGIDAGATSARPGLARARRFATSFPRVPHLPTRAARLSIGTELSSHCRCPSSLSPISCVQQATANPLPAVAAPASPPRAPSASSSSGGSAPHSPSLEERIRSLDEKYEKWSGSRAAAAEAAERGRFRHRLLDIVDIKEVKPSDVARSLLAKRSVFDEDSERLEGSVSLDKSTSPSSGSPRAREARTATRALQYPFPSHPPPPPSLPPSDLPVPELDERVPANGTPARSVQRDSRQSTIDALKSEFKKSFVECSAAIAKKDSARTLAESSATSSGRSDPHPNRTERLLSDSQFKPSDLECRQDMVTSDLGIRSSLSTTNKSHPDIHLLDKKNLEKTDRDKIHHDRDPRRDSQRKLSENLSCKTTKEHNLVKQDSTEETPGYSKDLNEDKISSDIREELLRDVMSGSNIETSNLSPGEEKENKTKTHFKENNNEIESSHEDKSSHTECVEIQHTKTIVNNVENTQEIKDVLKSVPVAKVLQSSDSENTPLDDKIDHEVEVLKSEVTTNAGKEKEILESDKDFTSMEGPSTEVQNSVSKSKTIEKAGDEIFNAITIENQCNVLHKQENKGVDIHKEEIKYLNTFSHKQQCPEDEKTKNGILENRKKEFAKDETQTGTISNDKDKLEKEQNKLELEKLKIEKEKIKEDLENLKIEKEKSQKEKLAKENIDKESPKIEKDLHRYHRDRNDREGDRHEEKQHRYENKKERSEKDKRKEDNTEVDLFNQVSKSRKEDKHKHDRNRKEHHESRRDHKKEKEGGEFKSREVSRKSSRDESSREMHRKDSSDSTTSRASHESAKCKEFEGIDSQGVKENSKHSGKHKHSSHDSSNHRSKSEKEQLSKISESRKHDTEKHDKAKEPIKSHSDHHLKDKIENHIEKQRHYSFDSSNVESKRKERLTSSSSLPSNIGQKRRISSQDVLDCMVEESKKAKVESKIHERRDSKESKSTEKSKTPKFNKGHFAKLLESKIKDDKKNMVKTPDEKCDDSYDASVKENKSHSDKSKCDRKSPKITQEETKTSEAKTGNEIKIETVSPRGIEFLATLELRSSEEDEKQKALRKEMKEKKRIQQLQQIQELQMQQDAMNQCEINKMKDDKRLKNDDRKKEAAREKRMSIERKSRESDKKRSSKLDQSSDTTDSDEPKKYSIFDIVDDGPTYISMYDKVKARSCKNMQKQEEEKRQEKIKAKFSQLKQSRAKREEKKRSNSWDEDSDSEQDRKKYSQKYSMVSSSDDDERNVHSGRQNPFQNFEMISKLENLSNYYNDPAVYDDQKRKLSRKNSRSRIMSDTSDDDTIKINAGVRIRNHVEIKKEVFSDAEYSTSDYVVKSKEIKKESYSNIIKQEMDDKYNKHSLMNLFDDNMDDKKALKKLLKNENNHVKATELFLKSEQMGKHCNDFSSEGELSAKFCSSEIRKKHKKKQKKPKSSISEEDAKSTDYSEKSPLMSSEAKHRVSLETSHNHLNRKERRKDKARESIDSEDLNFDKIKTKKGKNISDTGFETSKVDCCSNNIRRDEKMQNIFGPLSDDSDVEQITSNSHCKRNYNSLDLSTAMSKDKMNFMCKNIDVLIAKDKEREETRRKKERKRKEKRYIANNDDNSLDVDAAGKAIEESLFADSVSENENQNIKTKPIECSATSEHDVSHFTDCDDNLDSSSVGNELKQLDKIRRENKEKKKKKKRSKDERQNRHHHHVSLPDKFVNDSCSNINSIPLNDHNLICKNDFEAQEVNKSVLQSPSLPRITDSPPPLLHEKIELLSDKDSQDGYNISEDMPKEVKDTSQLKETSQSKDTSQLKEIENDGNITATKSKDCPEFNPDTKNHIIDAHQTSDQFILGYSSNIDEKISENAVKSISDFDKPKEAVTNEDNSVISLSTKQDDKLEEKARAVISQEETEDAVAALLGESFSHNDSFASCYDDVEDNSSARAAGTSAESEKILEEDAEEMRQAVQNLNASELELKPDTPLSENDLQIDTDTEELDDSQQETPEKLPAVTSLPVSTSTPVASLVIDSKVKPPQALLMNMPTANKITGEIITKPLNFQRYEAVSVKPEQPQRDVVISPTKREVIHQITSTATPVISTTWTLSGNKLREPHIINVNANHINNRDEQQPKLTANIVQLRPPMAQNVSLSSQPRAIIGATARMNSPFVINQMLRPGHIANMRPPTIKIPEHHVVYQKQGVVISPRMSADLRLQSPKSSPQSDLPSPRLTILSPNPPGIGLPSPTSTQQRSPSHVTVVRMQQPPLSPIQTMHVPHAQSCRTMVSPNRPNSVLVQPQASPIHLNRLPIASLSKPALSTHLLQSPKNITLNANHTSLHPQKNMTDIRKPDPRTIQDLNENPKLIISASSQPSTNPTVMAQNRLIMQNTSLHMANKIMFNNSSHTSDKREMAHNIPFKQETLKPDQIKTYGQSPIILQVNQSAHTTMHSVHKPTISIGHDFASNRPHTSNVIHTVNSQRLLTTATMTSVIQGDPHKTHTPSVLSMAPTRTPGVLTRFEKPANVSVTSSVLSNVVMTPVMVKTSSYDNFIQETKNLEPRSANLHILSDQKPEHTQLKTYETDSLNKPSICSQKELVPLPYQNHLVTIAKCVTDFKELLTETANEIKIPKDMEEDNNATISDVSSASLSVVPDSKDQNLNVMTEKTENPVTTLLDTLESGVKSESENETKDENEGWSAKDVNIESVIKKVDDLCNNQEHIESSSDTSLSEINKPDENIFITNGPDEVDTNKPMEVQVGPTEEETESRKTFVSKRGARSTRGKKTEKQNDRVQTRQISKPARGSPASRRGRGARIRVDRKMKSTPNSVPTLSGDIYDFHDDSGDETHESSQNKNESRPRLILTIKSPLTICTSTSTSTATTSTVTEISREQQPLSDKSTLPQSASKEEKSEDFLSPAPNTRKSRRLQEKDVGRTTVDDVIDDVVKNVSSQPKPVNSKEANGRRTTRAKMNAFDKSSSEVRKSPRGGKRTRDRSSSETSMDSSDEKLKREDGGPSDAKIPKLSEIGALSATDKCVIDSVVITAKENISSENSMTATALAPATILPPKPITPAPTPSSTPIMKPPKKMISEISAKLGSNFDALPINPVAPKEPECAPLISGGEKLRTEAAGMPQGTMKAQAEPPGAGPCWGGGDEPDLRVQSPALPHRPHPPHPLAHRQPDRATPVLIRAGESEALEACRASPARAGAVGAVGPGGAGLGARAYRGSFDASLPRGAHHPPPPPPALHPALARKQVAVGPLQARVTHITVPSGSPQGSITGEGMYPHFSHPHYQVYQQHFRATQQDARATPSPYNRSPREAEGSEAPTPPLELRRPPPSARVPRPAHSPSLADRLISGRGSPPPAHGGAGVSRLPSALPPPGPAGPPHASQVPREADSLQMLLRRYPVMWQGLLALKNDGAAVQMHFVHGNPGVAAHTLPRHVDGSTPPLRIAQRMRLEPLQLEAVSRKMQMENEHCMLLALPCGRDHMDVLQQSTNLTAGFITYLQSKQAAGIVNVAPPGHQQAMYTVHIFPACEFANENLNRIAPDLLHRVADIAHLLIVIATV